MCADCTAPVEPRPYKFVPRFPDRCEACRRRHRRRQLYRAYLVSALRIALDQGVDERGDTATSLRQLILAADLGATWDRGS